ncbi:uncharacterized protein ZMO1_ZMO1506 [Zymomonas mobilis subsp. mobilis ZM4 = ATCC 31821]|uniref:Uncharacterized protein n=1 Tax=Zymomonas mobilis subsp. mobilis (strain ATCC 31821 / ZM4 / CP4) TaxID=264203 RepID=Q5NMD0_ZYMMO|nr:hypothetical protein [Zymomonas mobilis]AAV90130.1 hypothetical protein ZMO1506 [Zymomonas mobilis subsp. mobilis ZM4 = ATCC 31821]ART94027.1 hypothetical protein B9T50_07860 [Zymomonas mobilis subsp. mobilis]AVZ26347.1 hypothetical protein ZMO2_ZMO1506 [Zymomonas mobilis subsp. mobilis]AVZ28234.1 hypothetical protein ZMO3_ZMO1506 [Zymomonas mobilis subsp. mobilis]AVZ42679.1 uncharacterized protein ZMO1_ZMO1506 [Zymomonas mobilis subsp. mobilis ZM4 = ATCC 31821]
MVSRIVETLVQAEINRADQGDSLKNLVTGALVVGAIRRLGPVGLILGTGYVLGKAYIRRRALERIEQKKWLEAHPEQETEIYAETAGMLPHQPETPLDFQSKKKASVKDNPA